MQTITERVDSLEAVLERFIARTESLSKDIDRMVEENDKQRKENEKSRKEADKVWNRLDQLGKGSDEIDKRLDKISMDIDRMAEENEKYKKENEKRREEYDKERKEMNKQWAALAQKMGTLDEDLVAPAVRPVLNKHFNCDFTTRTIRVIRRMGGENFEVDVLAVAEDKVFMIEVKSSPKSEYVDQILEKTSQFKKFFPEYKDKELIPIYASIIFPDDVVKYATRKCLYVMSYREWEYMDIMNFEEVKKVRQS